MLLRITGIVVAIALVGAYILWDRDAGRQHGEAVVDAESAEQSTTTPASEHVAPQRRTPANARPQLSAPGPAGEVAPPPRELVVNRGATPEDVPRKFSAFLEEQGVSADAQHRIYRAIADAQFELQRLMSDLGREKDSTNATEYGDAEDRLAAELSEIIQEALTDEQYRAFRQTFAIPIMLATNNVASWRDPE